MLRCVNCILNEYMDMDMEIFSNESSQHCISSLPKSCLQNDVIASRLFVEREFFFPGAICHRLRVLRCDWLLVDLIHAVNYHASQSVNKNNIS